MPISCSKCHFLFLIQDKPKLTKPQLARSLALSRSLSQLYNPTPLTHQLSLHVLLASDPAREEMFCLILKCEVSCQVSLVTDLFGRGGEKKKREKKRNERVERKCLCYTRQPSHSRAIKVNRRQLAVKYSRMFGHIGLSRTALRFNRRGRAVFLRSTKMRL